MAVTEQDLEQRLRDLRSDLATQISTAMEELRVAVMEEHNRCSRDFTLADVEELISAAEEPILAAVDERLAPLTEKVNGISTPTPPRTDSDELRASILEEVERLLDALPAPAPPLTAEELQSMIVYPEPYDDDDVKGRILRLRVHTNGLADRIGAPRMEG